MKKRLVLMTMVLTMGVAGAPAMAEDVATEIGTEVSQTGEEMVEPQAADTIETHYRYYNGHLQYRRWNATKNHWVDPYWITIG